MRQSQTVDRQTCKYDESLACTRQDRKEYQGSRLLYHQGKCFDCSVYRRQTDWTDARLLQEAKELHDALTLIDYELECRGIDARDDRGGDET